MTIHPDPYASDLELWIQFNEGSGAQVADSSSKARVITEFNFQENWDNSNLFNPACLYSYNFDSAFSEYLRCAIGEDNLAEGVSMGGLVYIDSLVSSRTIMSSYDSGVGEHGFLMAVYSDGRVEVWIHNTGATLYRWRTDPGVISAGQYYFIVCTWDASATGVKCYVDGVEVAFTTTASFAGTHAYNTRVEVGRYAGSWYMDGQLDHLFYYSTELPADRILQMFGNIPNLDLSLDPMDLEDPVIIMKEHLQENFSQVPVAGPNGFERGGYPASFGVIPQIVQIEGEENQLRRGEIHLQNDPAKGVILLYEASWVPTEGKDVRQDFRDIEARVSIDIRTVLGRRALNALFKECKRIVYLIHRIKNTDNSGNWSYIEPISRLNLTNRSRGLWRITYDVRFVKVSEFSGD